MSDYYPFGERWTDPYSATSDNRYLYNGKEMQSIAKLNVLDYGARMYNPKLGRWSTMDPLSELYYSYSPYAYVGNNPIKRTDPTGMEGRTKRIRRMQIKRPKILSKALRVG